MHAPFFIMPTFNPSPNAHVMTGDDAFYGDGQDDTFSPLTAFLNFMSGSTQQQQLQSNQQEFQEYMYNEYNSPEALVRQFKDAGLNVNMLGSTSFGTANGAAAAPAAAPAHGAIEGLAKVAETGANVANLVADTGLKVAQKSTEMTLPDLNRVLTGKYGVESQLTDIQYNTAKQTLDWMRDDRECTAMTMRVAYFQACQMYKNSVQEFQNMVKEGQLLDESIDREHWEASIKKQIHDFFVDHHYFPDQNYLDYIYNEYVINSNADGFNKWMNGQKLLFEHQNREAARFGAYGNSIKVLGVEVPLEYILQKGIDLADLVDDIRNNPDKNKPGFKWPWQYASEQIDDIKDNFNSKPEFTEDSAVGHIAKILKDNPDISNYDLAVKLEDAGFNFYAVFNKIGKLRKQALKSM